MTRFIERDDGTIFDDKTGLIWSKGTVAKSVTADQAVAALSEGWRLPTPEELFSLVDHSRYEPAINTDVFPDTESDWYWTSTPCAWWDDAVWVVVFGGGGVSGNHRNGKACVRAVRSGQ